MTVSLISFLKRYAEKRICLVMDIMKKRHRIHIWLSLKNREEGKIDKKWLKNKIYDSIATVVMNENVTRTDVADE